MQHLFRFLVCFLCAGVALHAEDVLRPGSVGQESSTNDNEREGRQWHAGIEAGLTASFFSQDISDPLANSVVAGLESGSGLAPYLSVYIDAPSSFSESLSYRVKLAYDQKNYSSNEQGIVDCVLGGTTVVPATIDVDFESTVAYFDLATQLHWQANENIFIVAGPVFQFAMADIELTADQTMLSPDECGFDTNGDGVFNSKTRTASEDEAGTETFRLGIEIGGGYAFPIGDNLELTPSIVYQHMFTAPLADRLDADNSRQFSEGTQPVLLENAALNSLIFTIGLRFGL